MKKILFINPPVVCVNECQQGWYSYAHPTSILKLIAWHREKGHQVYFVDCMEYDVQKKKTLALYKKLPLGTNKLGLQAQTHVLGKSIAWLIRELHKQKPPDEIWVSCHMTFNNGLAHQAIQAAQSVFPEARILFGGNYPTLFPEQAGQSGAEVHSGSIAGAERLFPDYSLFSQAFNYIVFQLNLGCENNCAHCVNTQLTRGIVRLDIQALVQDLKQKIERYAVFNFINIDPNVASYDLKPFLEECIRRDLKANLYFYGGIQPDKVDKKLVSLMQKANVKGLTLPRELEESSNASLHKSYAPSHFRQAIELFKEVGFDTSDFHCSFPVGFKDDCLLDIASIIREMNELNTIAEIAPVAFIPGTLEYERHLEQLQGKTLEELNWALWPALDSAEQILAHCRLYNAAHGGVFQKPWKLA